MTAVERRMLSHVNLSDASIERLALTTDHKKMLTLGKGRGKTSGLIDVDVRAGMSVTFRLTCLDLMLSGNLRI